MTVMIENYQKANSHRVASFVSLGSLRYLSVLKQVNAMVGNSSSGLLEAPACGVATVNIGDRQRGRITGASVINCLPIAEEIRVAIHTALSDEFLKHLKFVENPYGQGGASEKIKDILKQVSLQDILKKHFYDVSTI
jgi:UDP-N-acetylglucosamine 2-epimerase